jgi:hypothetical protein
VKWFRHDNNLRNTRLNGIRRTLGAAGYGRAMILLEVLSENTKDGPPFRLPLDHPSSDLSFWSSEFGCRNVETEKVLAVFEKYGLILEWKKSKMISAPILSELLDDFTKRKGRSAQENPEKAGPASTAIPPSSQDSTPTPTPTPTEQNTTPTRHHTTPQDAESVRSDSELSTESEDWIGRFGVAFAQAGKGILSRVGQEDVEELHEDAEKLLGVWLHWIATRNLEGLRHPLVKFAQEYREAAVSWDQRPEAKEAEMAKQMAEAFTADKARLAAENEQLLRDEQRAAATVNDI